MRELPAGATRMVSEITIKEISDYLKLDFETLEDSEKTELSVILNAAKTFIKDYTGLPESQIDEYDSFVIVVYVLCTDMYDNRSYYVDKSSLNQVVQTILGMYSINLL